MKRGILAAPYPPALPHLRRRIELGTRVPTFSHRDSAFATCIVFRDTNLPLLLKTASGAFQFTLP